SERGGFLHAGMGRRGATVGTGTRAGGGGSRIRIWISRGGHRVFAIHLWVVFKARGEYIAAGFAGRNAADGGGIAEATQLCARTGGTARTAAGVGAVVGGIDGEPPIVSGAGVFPVAARQPVVDCGADGDSGC